MKEVFRSLMGLTEANKGDFLIQEQTAQIHYTLTLDPLGILSLNNRVIGDLLAMVCRGWFFVDMV